MTLSLRVIVYRIDVFDQSLDASFCLLSARRGLSIPFNIDKQFALMSSHRYERETTIGGLKETVSALEFSPDGKVLACGCEDGSITIYSAMDWKLLQTFIDVSPATSLTWHPQIEGLLFCGFRSGDVHTLRINRPRVRTQNVAIFSVLNGTGL